jgi:hypothetical protein
VWYLGDDRDVYIMIRHDGVWLGSGFEFGVS